jgi:hypothetical protein
VGGIFNKIEAKNLYFKVSLNNVADIRMVLGISDQDPIVRGSGPDPDSALDSFYHQAIIVA